MDRVRHVGLLEEKAAVSIRMINSQRFMGRTDLIIDYLGIQYVVEMKIWHGQEYNTRSEKQLIGYLKDYGLKKGYMLSLILIRAKRQVCRNCILRIIRLLKRWFEASRKHLGFCPKMQLKAHKEVKKY